MINAKEARNIQHSYANQQQVLEEHIKRAARSGQYSICIKYERNKYLYCYAEQALGWLKELGYLVQQNEEQKELTLLWEY